MLKTFFIYLCFIMILVSFVRANNETNNLQGTCNARIIKPEDIYGITMVPIPTGSFRMGADDGEDDEKPVRTVTIDGFEMSATEVTQAQYKAVMGVNPSHFAGNNNFPVERVTWYDAVKFCNKLSDKLDLSRCYNDSLWICDFTKNGFRLPTEAEWEYACRAGTETEYYTGNTVSDLAKAGWYDYIEGNSDGTTHAVALKEPNAWGLYDMHGNVYEWVNDWYGDYEGDSVNNPTGTDSGIYVVLRGGSWFSEASYCRSAFRINDRPERKSYFSGFRVVRGARCGNTGE